ncbi:MAG: LD-carboxypeptidase [Sulfitobacter sp.]|nr:LD-carboxypeptidase [Sulfitobacter sp.]
MTAMTDRPLVPPRIRPGDRVRLVSPASFPDQASVDACLATLEAWGLRGEVAPHALDEWGYMAGCDADRLEDLNDAFRDPDVRAIVATRGGAGAYRIADQIDFAAVQADPKPLVGFSDITYLHLSLLQRCNLGGIHGCLVGSTAQASVRQLLMTADPIVARRTPEAVSAAVEVPGRAHGRLVGGNLASLATSIGVRVPSLSGAILFLEDQRAVGLGTIDRQLTQLISSGTLQGLVGVALGSFEGFRDYSDRGWTLVEVLSDRLGQLGVPVLGGLFAGHDLEGPDGMPDQTALPLGSMATLDTAAGTLITQPVVE